jgi:hypothetical protein
MANKDHLEILKKGVETWNKWREEHNVAAPDLSNIHLQSADLSNANLSLTNLSNATLRFANLFNANLSKANLTRAILIHARLSYAYLAGTDLRDADLRYSTLFNANFHDVKLTGADFWDVEVGWTVFRDTDLSVADGLDNVRHRGPSTIGIDTIYRSKGNIPEVFLRKAGVPENFITYMRSLAGQALEFYKCFISFTESDNLFSERLYNDLLAAGVRCWRWKEDAKWGQTLMRSIDEAVRIYDKLVVICGEQSLNSPAVIREIERALQKEDELARKGKENEVLFPIRLDDYVFTGWNHYRKADVTAKYIGDFCHWKEPAIYRISLERLINDLRAKRADEGPPNNSFNPTPR